MYPSGYRAIVRGRVAIVLLLVALPAVATAAVRPALVGTPRADVLLGREGPDRVDARAGNDRIAVEYDDGRDDVTCGPGLDVVTADLRDLVRPGCEIVGRRIHRDRFTNTDSQHESEVEPDSQTVGATTVALFQVGRNRNGGAASIGFSTSKDGGRTWREGILPGLTAVSKPAGPSARASDPVVAYDAAHGVWLANTLALAPGVSRLTIHRSTNGLTWSGPIDAAVAQSDDLIYDKNWLACDNGQASPFRGRCYLAYTLVGDRVDLLAVQRSDDGGRTWSAAVTQQLPVTGVIPVIQPDGKLVLTFWSGGTGMVSVTSTDGGVTLDEPVLISRLTPRDARPFRAPPLIAAELERAGSVLTAWQDCRFRTGCAANDVVISRSADGKTWSTPVRVTSGPQRRPADDRRRARHRPARDRVLRDPAQRHRRGADHVDGRDALERAAAAERTADAARVDAADDARADAGGLHRRQLGARAAAGRARARLAAARRQAAPGDLRRPRLGAPAQRGAPRGRGRSSAARPADGR